MRNLHLLRSRPDEVVRTLIDKGYRGDENPEMPLYEGPPDYEQLVNDFFACDRVISWW